MKTPERAAGPAIGAALAYFSVKAATPYFDWLTPADQAEAVAMLTVLYIHAIIEVRALFEWLIKRKNNA